MSEAMGFIDASSRPRSALAVDWRAPDRRRMLQLVLATSGWSTPCCSSNPFMFTKAFGNQMITANAAGNPTPLPTRSPGPGAPSGITPWSPTPPRPHPAGHRARYRLASDGQDRSGHIGRLGAQCLVDRRRTRARSHPHGQPPHRRPRCRDPLRVVGHPPVAHRAGCVDGAIRGRPSARSACGAGLVARPVGKPVLLRAPGRQPLAAGTARLDQGHGRRAAPLVVIPRQLGRHAGGAPGPRVLDRARHRPRRDRPRPFLSVTAARATIVAAVVLSAVLWVVGQGSATSSRAPEPTPTAGPLLMLVAAAFWPRPGPSPAAAVSEPGADLSRPLSLSGT